MKRQYMLFVIVLLFCTNTSAQQKEYSGKIHVTALSLQQEGDSVYVKLSFDISGVNVDSRRSISLIPALVAAGDRLDLPEVVVKGRENYNVYRRETALMSNREKATYAAEAPYAVVPGFKSGNAKTIAYSVAVKYNPWMADAKLDMYEDLCGCGNPARRIGITMLFLMKVEFLHESAHPLHDRHHHACQPYNARENNRAVRNNSQHGIRATCRRTGKKTRNHQRGFSGFRCKQDRYPPRLHE